MTEEKSITDMVTYDRYSVWLKCSNCDTYVPIGEEMSLLSDAQEYAKRMCVPYKIMTIHYTKSCCFIEEGV